MNVFIFVLLPSVSFSFLLGNKTSDSLSSGSFMTDSHYNSLMDMLHQERQSRQNLEQYVNHLHERLATQEQVGKALISRIDSLEHNTSKHDQIKMLNNRTRELETNFNVLLLREKEIKENFTNISFLQKQLRNDLSVLKSMEPFSQATVLSNITLANDRLRHNLERTDNNVNLLLSHDKARQQDFMAMLGEVNENRKKLNEKVAMTACASLNYDVVNQTDVVKFPRVQTSIGIQNMSSFVTHGVFTCELNGLYIVFANLISASNDGFFKLYKNSKFLSSAYTAFNGTGNIFSDSTMATADLLIGDVLSIKSERNNITINPSSCFAVIKVA